jgi:hypothetical protein
VLPIGKILPFTKASPSSPWACPKGLLKTGLRLEAGLVNVRSGWRSSLVSFGIPPEPPRRAFEDVTLPPDGDTMELHYGARSDKQQPCQTRADLVASRPARWLCAVAGTGRRLGGPAGLIGHATGSASVRERPPNLFLWSVTRCVGPWALRRVWEPLGSRDARYRPGEPVEVASQSQLGGW